MSDKRTPLQVPYSVAKALLAVHLAGKGIDVHSKDFDKEYGPSIMKLYGTDEPPVDMDHMVRPDLNDEQFADMIRQSRSVRMWDKLKEINEKSPTGTVYMMLTDENGHPTCGGHGCGECASCYDRELSFNPVIVGGNMGPIDYLNGLHMNGSGKTGLLGVFNNTRHIPDNIPLTSLCMTGGFRRGELVTMNSLGFGRFDKPTTSHIANLVRSMIGKKDMWHVSLENTPRGFAYDFETDVHIPSHPITKMAMSGNGLLRAYRRRFGFKNRPTLYPEQIFNLKELESKSYISVTCYGDIEVGGKKVPGIKGIPEPLRHGYRGYSYTEDLAGRTLYRKHYYALNGVSSIHWQDVDYYGDSMLLRPIDPRDNLGYPVLEDWAEEAIDKMIWLQLNKDHMPLSFDPTYGHVRSITNIGKPQANWRTRHVKEKARERLRQAISPGKDKRGY